jgi:hypothetical protein
MVDSAGNSVNVRISKRVLWVGTEAYPLQNIARAQAVKVIPKNPWTGKSRAINVQAGTAALSPQALISRRFVTR